MQWSDIPRDPSQRMLRQFAGLWLICFGLLAASHVGDNLSVAVMLAILALAVGVPGLIRPAIIRPIFVGAMIATFPVGWLVSKILLAFVYYGVFTPIALGFRLTGRDVLARRRNPAATTYWMPKPPPAGSQSYFRQF